MNISDLNESRGLAFFSPFEFPVRSGAITLVLLAAVDGQANKNFKDLVAEWQGCTPEYREFTTNEVAGCPGNWCP